MDSFNQLDPECKLRKVLTVEHWSHIVLLSDAYALLNLQLFCELQPRLELATKGQDNFYEQLRASGPTLTIQEYENIIIRIHIMMLIVLSPSELEAIIVSREPKEFQPVLKEELDKGTDDDLGWLWLALTFRCQLQPRL